MFIKTIKYLTSNQFVTVKANFEKSLDWLTDTYVDALNIIHYMTDKYNYEAVQMAFLPTKQRANMGFGICGFANTVDTLSAIKYATVKPIRDEDGYIYDYETIGEYPRWGEPQTLQICRSYSFTSYNHF